MTISRKVYIIYCAYKQYVHRYNIINDIGGGVKIQEEKTNKKYKDSVFIDLFYEDENALENELSLFNALFGTNYNAEDIEIKKIRVENTLYMNLRNDVSFNAGNKILVFSEHQSTINGNMPLRNLM